MVVVVCGIPEAESTRKQGQLDVTMDIQQKLNELSMMTIQHKMHNIGSVNEV